MILLRYISDEFSVIDKNFKKANGSKNVKNETNYTNVKEVEKVTNEI